ncbi:hypothetical protein WJX81_003980 [Elliptochloris bilobata]|uniref:Uncharacterized protein n=1 Tax=Elliptochloris bilobata TaxID=381761 RepID=A0AAW1RRG2_9CHLO
MRRGRRCERLTPAGMQSSASDQAHALLPNDELLPRVLRSWRAWLPRGKALLPHGARHALDAAGACFGALPDHAGAGVLWRWGMLAFLTLHTLAAAPRGYQAANALAALLLQLCRAVRAALMQLCRLVGP